MQQDASNFGANSLPTHAKQVIGVEPDGRLDLGVDLEVESCGEARSAEHAQSIFSESIFGATDRAKATSAQILDAPDEVDHTPIGGHLEEAVDGEVAPPRILLRGPELDARGPTAVEIVTIPPKGGHLDGVPHAAHEHHSETRANSAGSGEVTGDLLGPRIGGDVVIRWLEPEKAISHTAPGEKRDKTLGRENGGDPRRGFAR